MAARYDTAVAIAAEAVTAIMLAPMATANLLQAASGDLAPGTAALNSQ